MDIARGILMVLLGLTAIFLILLVLIQRGRGGGLAGAFGGMGGQSAFGTKAGDLFTRVTIVTAAIWILLCALSVKIFSSAGDLLAVEPGDAASQTDTKPGAKTKAPAEESGKASEEPGTPAKGSDKGSAVPASPAGSDKAALWR